MKVIGLTGVMGAGKSSVIAWLRQRLITVVDCDAINADLQRKGKAGYMALVQLYQDAILDEQQEIDAKKVSDIIFQDDASRRKVEAILHPLIKAEIQKLVQLHQSEAMMVVEVPLLFEVAWETFFDEVWVVACDEAILLERLAMFRHIDKQEAMRRLAHQMPQGEKIAKAHVVLWNNVDIKLLQQRINQEVDRLIGGKDDAKK